MSLIEPFTSKDVLLIRAISSQEDLAPFSCAEYAQFPANVTPSFASVFVVTINWEKVIIKVQGPFRKDQVELVIRTEVESYGKRVSLACGDPKREAIIVLRNETGNNQPSFA